MASLTPPVLLGVLTISAATLLLQIALTKFFSFRLWYHYAFMVISITMLGLSASSTALAYFERRLLQIPVTGVLQLGALLFGGSTLAALVALSLRADKLLPLEGTWPALMAVGGWWLALFPPFFFAGTVVSWAIQRFSSRISTVYAFDLAGASLGCVLAVVGLTTLFAEQCIALAGGLGFIAAALFSRDSARPAASLISVLVAGLAIAVGMLGPEIWGARVTETKGLADDLRRGARIIVSQPGMNGRVDVLEGAIADFAWGRSHLFHGPFPPQLAIRIDGDALTAVTRFDRSSSSWEFTAYMPASLPYVVTRPRSVLVIGAGGGMDLVNAINRGAARVVGVEINQPIIRLLQGPLHDFSGGIYSHPKVEVVHGDGRTYVERSNERFDLIQLTLVDTFAAISSGALALAEDFLYTTEAFQAYIEHLSSNGMLALGRTRQESLSLLSLLGAATRAREVKLDQHVVIARALATHGLILVFKASPFSPQEVASALDFVDRNGMELVYAPGHMERALPEVRAWLTASDRVALARELGRDPSLKLTMPPSISGNRSGASCSEPTQAVAATCC